MKIFACAFFASCLAGCSGSDAGIEGQSTPSSSEGDALYKPVSGGEPTPGDVFGVWAGTTTVNRIDFDFRMKIGASAMTFANRCRFPDGSPTTTAAVTATARVTADKIAVLETVRDEKKASGATCGAELKAKELGRCQDETFQRECFELAGTKLTMFGTSPLDKMELTKISD